MEEEKTLVIKDTFPTINIGFCCFPTVTWLMCNHHLYFNRRILTHCGASYAANIRWH
jgi:hypothetical protein